jgi:hypothetical protein
VTLADGRVLIVGGWTGYTGELGGGVFLRRAELYDPTSGDWSPAGDLAGARTDFVLVALPDGGALVAGGYIDRFEQTLAATAERFHPSTRTWSVAAEPPTAAARRTGIRLSDGRVLIAGGAAGDATVDAAESYDPATDSWTVIEPLPRPRAGAAGLLLGDGSALLVGGITAMNPDDTPSCPSPDLEAFRYLPGG